MQQCGFSNRKLSENLASEILDVCLVDALDIHGKESARAKICELDVTAKISEEVVGEMLNTMKDPQKCCVGIVDWLGKLENEGLLDEYLKI
jgi:broad-specificity NMP kinase